MISTDKQSPSSPKNSFKRTDSSEAHPPNQDASSISGLTLTECPNCQKCIKLQNMSLFLAQQLKKLENLESKINGKYVEIFKEKKNATAPLVEYHRVDQAAQSKTIEGLQQSLSKLSQHGKQQQQLLEQLIAGKDQHKYSPRSPGKVGIMPKKKVEFSPLYSSSKAEELQVNLTEIMESSNVSDRQVQKSQMSGSITSEHKSMIEKMSQEERDAYYAKQMKSRKMMAKLKKKK